MKIRSRVLVPSIVFTSTVPPFGAGSTTVTVGAVVPATAEAGGATTSNVTCSPEELRKPICSLP